MLNLFHRAPRWRFYTMKPDGRIYCHDFKGLLGSKNKATQTVRTMYAKFGRLKKSK